MAHRHRDTLHQLLRFEPDCLALFRDLLHDPDVLRRARLVAAGPLQLIRACGPE